MVGKDRPAISDTGRQAGEDFIIAPVSGWFAWGIASPPDEPDVRFIDPLVRRRLSPLDRAALYVANQCVKAGESVHLVFASRHGELNRNAGLLSEIASDGLPSPMGFSLSVLNALPGIYNIVRQDLSPSTAISAGEATLPLALVEASVQAWRKPDATILLVCADDPPPPVYAGIVDSPRQAYAIAIRLEASRMTEPVRCGWAAGSGSADPEDALRAIHDCLSRGNPTQWAGPDHLWQWQRDDCAA